MNSVNNIKCECCGQFISYEEIENGDAKFFFEPSNEFEPEVSEWTCGTCAKKDEEAA